MLSSVRRAAVAGAIGVAIAGCQQLLGDFANGSDDAGADGGGQASTVPSQDASPDATSAGQICTPGRSVACVGPGGCTGGQACASDGLRYEACQCAGGGSSSGSSGGSGGGSGTSSSSGGSGGACNTGWPNGTNDVSNPDFESGGAGWSVPFGGTFTVSSTTAYCGTHSGEISGRTAPSQGLVTTIPTTPGTYTVALWVLQDGLLPNGTTLTTGVDVSFEGLCTQSDGGQFSPDGLSLIASPNVWTFLSGTLIVPAGCSTMQLLVAQLSRDTVFPDLFVDEVYVGP